MKLLPRYDPPPVIAIDQDPASVLAPAVRQRRRFERVLAALDTEQWTAPTRCDGWDVADVVTHLIGVNAFWTLSISRGLAGAPTRYLSDFDPAVTPDQLVSGARGTPPHELLDQLVTTNGELVELVEDLDDDGWLQRAECPVGHLPVHLVLQHGLWDGWIHERDVLLPLGLEPTVEADEVTSGLVYACALAAAMGVLRGEPVTGAFGLAPDDPRSAWRLDVTDRVDVRPSGAEPTVPSLAGPAVDLLEALSLRTPLPNGTPGRWRDLLAGLTVAFSAER